MLSSIKKILSEQKIQQTVRVGGWVKTKRDSKAGVSFIQLNDGSCFENLQLVFENDLITQIADVTSGASLLVEGLVVQSGGANQTVEIQVKNILYIGLVDSPLTYPIQPKKHTMEFLRLHPHLRVRTNTFGAVARMRHFVAKYINDFFSKEEFLLVHTPVITTSDCEGAGELFHVSTLDMLSKHQNYAEDFFGRETFLTVSGQLNVETYCCALSKVYTFGPTFRAENSNTSRHLAEFWMIEPELAFTDLNGVIDLADNLLRYVISNVLEHNLSDLQFFDQMVQPGVIARLEKYLSSGLITITYTEAIEHLLEAKKKINFEYPVAWGLDLQSEHERYICEQLFNAPVAITNYPKEIKSFYMRLNADGKTVAAMDIVVPGIGEIVGGSVREERFEILAEKMRDANLGSDYDWYLDIRRYGTVPHGGFGLGFERLLGYITGMANVRDLIPFPRTPGNALL